MPFCIFFSLETWKTKRLNRSLCVSTSINVDNPKCFPEDENFKPLNDFMGNKIIDANCIDTWFFERKAVKGKDKGRILAIKLFIKYTQVLKMK